MKKNITFLIFMICILLYGCGGAGDIYKPKIKTTDTYNFTKDQVWSAIIATLGDMNFPIKTIEKASWLIQSDRVNISAQDVYSYCAIEGESNYKNGRLSFTFYLKGNDSLITDMTITSDFEGTYVSGIGQYAQTDVIQLYSNGKYEKDLFEAIRKRIKS
jgi:hypothetical protein